MIDQNTKNTCHLIKQAFIRAQKPLSLSDAQCQELAIAFTFLRRVDCLIGQYSSACSVFYNENREKLSDKQLDKELIKISGGYPFYNVSGYNFNGLLNSGLSVEVGVMSYVQGLSPNVRQILQDMNFAENVATLFRQSRYLVDIFEVFSDLNLSLSGFNNQRFIGLITTLVSDGFKHNGLCPTPIGLSKLICECLFCKDACKGLEYNGIDISDELSIYDPVCGTGSLLAYAGEFGELTGQAPNVYLFGNEISSFSCAIANALVLLTGDEYSFVDNVNTLTKEESSDDEFQFVVADLPFGLPWTPIRERIERESQKENGRFSKGLPSTNDSQFLFIQDIVSKMDSMGGRAAFITSGDVLNGGSVKSGESRIRRWLFESGLVETIIALPSRILSPYTNIPVFLWILSCNPDPHCNEFCEKMEGKVRLIDATKLVSSNKQFYMNDEFITSVVKEYKSLEDTAATKIVNKEDFGFYELKIEEKGKRKETVRISLDTDINDFIEKERKPYSKGEITIYYESVEKGFSVDFCKFFKPEDIPIAPIEEESARMLQLLDTIGSVRADIEATTRRIVDETAHDSWNEMPLWSIAEIVQAKNRSHVVDMRRGLPIISKEFLRGEISDMEYYAVTSNATRSYANDVFVFKRGANAGMVFKGAKGMILPALTIIRCTDESIISPKYLYYLLKGYEKSFKLMTKGATTKQLDIKAVLDCKFLIPSIDEQEKIACFLDEVVNKIDNVIASIKGSNTIFSEYRQTLIENAVRGRIQHI